MLQATLAKDTETMTKIIQYAHNTEVPILSYNNETEFSAIVNLVYLSARDQYRVEREEKAGKGFVDFIFYPVRYDQDCIILELKVDHSPEDAIAQIKEKDYALRFRGKTAEKINIQGVSLRLESVITKKQKSMIVKWKKYKSERKNMNSLQRKLFELQDLKYRNFHSKLMPGIDKETIIGIRTPVLRKFAKEFAKRKQQKLF